MKLQILVIALLKFCTTLAIVPVSPIVVKHHVVPAVLTGPLYGYTYAISPTAVHLYSPGVAVAPRVPPPPLVVGRGLQGPIIVKSEHVPVLGTKEVPVFIRKEVFVPAGTINREGVLVPKKKDEEDNGGDQNDEKEELREKEAVRN